MAASLAIEEEQGAFTGHFHPHNGYYAGDFANRDASAASAPTTTTAPAMAMTSRL